MAVHQTSTPAIPNALTIAGSDPSGGAGLQADLKTFAAHRVYGTSVVTALTAQNTMGVDGVFAVPASFVRSQLNTLLDDVRVDAVKIGMLGQVDVAAAVHAALVGPLSHVPVVLDPVMVATSGDSLAAEGMLEALLGLLPHVSLVTPNLPEAAALSGMPLAGNEDEMLAQAHQLRELGAPAVLLKGGHLDGGESVDLLVDATGAQRLAAARVPTRNTHGTGCTLSSAIAANLAHGVPLDAAVRNAKGWLVRALATADELVVGDGSGHGPVNHFAPL